MYNPVIITLVSMLVGFAVLIGLNHLVNRLDDRLRQRQAPFSFKRWPPSVRPVSDQVLEIGEYSSARWDQVPALLLGAGRVRSCFLRSWFRFGCGAAILITGWI